MSRGLTLSTTDFCSKEISNESKVRDFQAKAWKALNSEQWGDLQWSFCKIYLIVRIKDDSFFSSISLNFALMSPGMFHRNWDYSYKELNF